MRLLALVLLVLAGATACSGATHAGTPTGCGAVSPERVAGVLGDHTRSTATGSVARLREHHRALRCRVTVPGHPERYLVVRAAYHPRPLTLPASACSAGWVYAGSTAKSAPACQDTVSGHGRTQLMVRWQAYLVRVTIGRSDRNWGGDPEVALAMSRELAQQLGVREARGDS